MLTLGDKYEASILNSVPTAPSIAQPKCKPPLMLTRLPFPRRCCKPGWLRYCASTRDRCTAARILTNASMAMSASFRTSALSRSSARQIARKVSPLFLLAAPWHSFTMPCTISATLFTNAITFVCSTCITVLKLRTRRTPITQLIFVPSTMACTQALSMPRMLCAIMLVPASPKPTASKDPSLMMVFSRSRVSMGSLDVRRLVHGAMAKKLRSSVWREFLSLVFLISSALNAASSMFMAVRGFLRILSTLDIIVSRGWSTSLSASCEKRREAEPKATQTNNVTNRE
mmetsp:Transcript_28064/g.55144  ORF Transcript_28064/g.55144 Transcript_28064/m.55144 type:complete len:286 (+) Transcript_28064:475-1332(+)